MDEQQQREMPPAPIVSPDGQWLWDGQQWQPRTTQAEPASAISAPASKRRGRLLLAAMVAGLLAAGTLSVLVPPAIRSSGRDVVAGHVLTGSITVFDSSFDDFGAGCQGRGGFDDMQADASVTVTDESGTVLGASHLGEGKRDGFSCVFPFSVTNLPDAKFYGVEVSHRGRATYSAADLDDAGWKIGLRLGA